MTIIKNSFVEGKKEKHREMENSEDRFIEI